MLMAICTNGVDLVMATSVVLQLLHSTLSSIDQPAHGDFILAQVPPYDWRSPQNDNLWQGVNGIKQPMSKWLPYPNRSRVRSRAFKLEAVQSAGAIASPLKLPMAGYRTYSSGSLSNVGTNGPIGAVRLVALARATSASAAAMPAW